MTTTHHVKMAKASQKDIDGAIELYQFLEAMRAGRPAADAVEEFDYEGYGDLIERRADDAEYLLRAHERGGLFRVAWGLQVLLDPANEVVDPNLPHLELHPKHEQAAKERDEARAQLATLKSQRDALVKATGGFVDAFDGHGAFDGLFWGADSWMTAMRDALQAALRPTARAQPEQPDHYESHLFHDGGGRPMPQCTVCGVSVEAARSNQCAQPEQPNPAGGAS